MKELLKRLQKEYPNPAVALNYKTPFELLIAVMLSAQCTDARVNMVTETLFKKYKTPADYLVVSQDELENDIRSTGFFRNKARNIRAMCKKLLEEYNGEVPDSMDLLLTLPGVGRKTANCVLGEAYNISSGIVVDTHVTRLSNRLGLTRHKDAEKIEKDIMQSIPKKNWIKFGNYLIHHGRKVCHARKPRCTSCVLEDICPSAEEFISKGQIKED
jgi:endonuclease III